MKPCTPGAAPTSCCPDRHGSSQHNLSPCLTRTTHLCDPPSRIVRSLRTPRDNRITTTRVPGAPVKRLEGDSDDRGGTPDRSNKRARVEVVGGYSYPKIRHPQQQLPQQRLPQQPKQPPQPQLPKMPQQPQLQQRQHPQHPQHPPQHPARPPPQPSGAAASARCQTGAAPAAPQHRPQGAKEQPPKPTTPPPRPASSTEAVVDDDEYAREARRPSPLTAPPPQKPALRVVPVVAHRRAGVPASPAAAQAAAEAQFREQLTALPSRREVEARCVLLWRQLAAERDRGGEWEEALLRQLRQREAGERALRAERDRAVAQAEEAAGLRAQLRAALEAAGRVQQQQRGSGGGGGIQSVRAKGGGALGGSESGAAGGGGAVAAAGVLPRQQHQQPPAAEAAAGAVQSTPVTAGEGARF